MMTEEDDEEEETVSHKNSSSVVALYLTCFLKFRDDDYCELNLKI